MCLDHAKKAVVICVQGTHSLKVHSTLQLTLFAWNELNYYFIQDALSAMSFIGLKISVNGVEEAYIHGVSLHNTQCHSSLFST